MRLLVTGGAGFIGSNFVYWELENHKEDEIFVLDSLTYAGNLKTLEPILDKIVFIKEDITNRNEIFNIFEKYRFDYVVNFAAETHVDRSIDDPQVFLKTNVLGTQNLLDASKKFGVKRFHQVSTDEVYGDLPIDRKDLLFKETNNLHTSSPYSASKASSDLLVMAYNRTYGSDITISRCSNNYGRFQFPEKLIPLIIYRAMENKSIPVYGNGLNIRDWLHVKDHCIAIDLILRNAKKGEIYNIGGNNEKTNIEVVKSVLRILNKSEDLITYVLDRPGHDLRYAIDSSKIQKELNWKPTYSFEEGLKETVEWYLNNEEWWKEIVSGEYTQYYENMYIKKGR